jgi:SAM-dependent methyltransferase
MSTQHIYAAVMQAAMPAIKDAARHLDIGAGRGELIREINKKANLQSFACDFHIERFSADVPCIKVNLNNELLPYQDSQFDLITCSEVIEHLENYRTLLREAFRVTKGGGLMIITTPNVLNMLSRVRYFISGFANLFGPLPVRNDKLYSTGGHITPIPYFYLAHALLGAGFTDIRLGIDKPQKTSIFWVVLLGPLIGLAGFRFMFREKSRYRTITAENAGFVKAHFSWPLLVGRTIVVTAKKP